jgi:hypothetical protein
MGPSGDVVGRVASIDRDCLNGVRAGSARRVTLGLSVSRVSPTPPPRARVGVACGSACGTPPFAPPLGEVAFGWSRTMSVANCCSSNAPHLWCEQEGVDDRGVNDTCERSGVHAMV